MAPVLALVEQPLGVGDQRLDLESLPEQLVGRRDLLALPPGGNRGREARADLVPPQQGGRREVDQGTGLGARGGHGQERVERPAAVEDHLEEDVGVRRHRHGQLGDHHRADGLVAVEEPDLDAAELIGGCEPEPAAVRQELARVGQGGEPAHHLHADGMGEHVAGLRGDLLLRPRLALHDRDGVGRQLHPVRS